MDRRQLSGCGPCATIVSTVAVQGRQDTAAVRFDAEVCQLPSEIRRAN